MELIRLNTVALHARWLILENPVNSFENSSDKLLDSVIKFNLKNLFTSLSELYKFSERQLKSAINYNSVYFTKFLIEQYKFKLKSNNFYNIKITSFKFLKFLNDKNLKSKIKKEIFNSVAKGGKLDLVEFCHDNKYPWNEDICSAAAYSGHLDCLLYAHENGCPWNETTCQQNGHLKCLKYAIDNGCEYNLKKLKKLSKSKKIKNYLNTL